MPLAKLLASALAAAAMTAVPLAALGATTQVFIGTHTSGPGGGLFTATFDEATGRFGDLTLAAQIDRPTWQVSDLQRRRLFSTSETGNDGKSEGGLLSFREQAAALAPIDRTGSGGGGATYVDFDPRSQTVFVANYANGEVASIPVAADGALGAVVSKGSDYGSGPHRRQTGPHAHAAVIDPSGRYVLVPDLGADRVFVYSFDPSTRRLAPAATPFLQFPAGSGPRHLVFASDGRHAFLITELSAQVFTLAWDGRAGRLQIESSQTVSSPQLTNEPSASELALSKDGKRLFVGDRPENSIVVFAVDSRSGALRQVQRQDCLGKNPWSFALTPDGAWLLVANEASDGVSVLRINESDGTLSAFPSVLPVSKPVSFAFMDR